MGDSGKIHLSSIWTVRPGNENDFIAAWKEFAALSSHAEGAIAGILLRDVADASRFISFGTWTDPETARAWRHQPEFRKAFARFMELCDEITPGVFQLIAESSRAETG
ncbi:MAG TPA: antibiotic biosynthesis monooxygenase family protein [Methanomicrobiales archaeon]|nr:antibiotic biosynthesis monooxygenase family protein [Methanomicrobiales archaeon]